VDSNDNQSWLTLVISVLLIIYPFVAHFAVSANQYLPAVVILFSVFTLLAWSMFAAGNRFIAVLLLLLLSVFSALLTWGNSLNILYVLPIILYMMLFIFFFTSLRKSSTPIITRFAILMENEVGEEKRIYTRTLTKVWAVFFAIMLVESLALILFASPKLWSLFTNFINYIFIGVFFVAEYFIRIRMLPHLEHLGPLEFFYKLSKIEFKKLFL